MFAQKLKNLKHLFTKRFFRSDLAGVSGFNRFNLHKDPFYEMRLKEYTDPKKPSVTVSVTGAAGNIGYALLFNIARWGNHSPSMFPDLHFAKVYGEHYRHTFGNLEFDKWNREKFIPAVQNRGAEVIKARGSSSAASAANAIVDHMRDWVFGTNQEKMWVSMAVRSDGSYGIPEGLWSGFPVDCIPQKGYRIIKDLPLISFQNEMIKRSVKEMLDERDAVSHLLN